MIIYTQHLQKIKSAERVVSKTKDIGYFDAQKFQKFLIKILKQKSQ